MTVIDVIGLLRGSPLSDDVVTVFVQPFQCVLCEDWQVDLRVPMDRGTLWGLNRKDKVLLASELSGMMSRCAFEHRRDCAGRA